MQSSCRNFWALHLVHVASPPEVDNKLLQSKFEKRWTTRTNAQSVSPRNIWFVPGLIYMYKQSINKTIFNKCYKFQNDLINIPGDIIS